MFAIRPNKNGCYFTHFVEGTVPFHVIDGQQSLYKPQERHRGYNAPKISKIQV
ncbi:BQ5605_C022g09591 [Microbotryum silenes-dioicae]|uniref:BQ5605_C022g09591 protein n=1 Tax=Microbotryum silenes-dioicae TaxID=796604 RepID=A0A2X0ML45_9BASI|nr:BQ5605_C022g09591 [Microbotryum silenes-dioicae]